MSSGVCCRRSFSRRNWIPCEKVDLNTDFRINPGNINARNSMWKISKCQGKCRSVIAYYKKKALKVLKHLGTNENI